MRGFADSLRMSFAEMYRNGCTPLDPRETHEESYRSFYGTALPAAGLFLLIGAIAFLVVRTATADQFTPPALRWIFPIIGVPSMAIAVGFWKRVWAIDDRPTIEIAAAHPGTVEVVGKVRTGGPATAWFSGLRVVWWEAEVTEWQRMPDGKRRLKTIWKSKGGHRTFWIDDGTGLLEVNANSAASSGARVTVDRTLNDHHIIERALVIDDTVFATGPVQLVEDNRLVMRRPRTQLDAGQNSPFWITFSESRLRAGWRGIAMFLTATALLVAAAYSLFTVAPSTDPAHLGQNTLLLKQSPILVLFLVVLSGGLGLQLIHYSIRLFNRLVGLKEQVAFAWATIDVAAARRHTLISELAGAASASADHERQTLETVIRTRSQLPSKERVDAVGAEFKADRVNRSLIGRQEAHPNILAAEAFQELFDELIESENRIAASRKFYNDAVVLLKDRSKSFPGVILAPLVLGGSMPPMLSFDDDNINDAAHGVAGRVRSGTEPMPDAA